MMRLFFRDKSGNERYVCNVTENGVGAAIYKDVAARFGADYHVYYLRHWQEENGTHWYDFGSYTEFYIVREVADNDF